MKQIGSAVAGLAMVLTLGACGSNDAGMKAPSSAAYAEAGKAGQMEATEPDAAMGLAGESRGGMDSSSAESAANGQANRDNVAATRGINSVNGAGGTPALSAAARASGASGVSAGTALATRNALNGSRDRRAMGRAGSRAPREMIVRAEREPRVAPIVPAFPSRIKHRTLRGLDTIFFGFDLADLSQKTRQALDENIAWMKKHGGFTIRLLGHADERGTSEYNLGLGMRRANKVREYLVANGISGDLLETVSYGEEMPLHRGRNEESWRQNRRVEFSRPKATVALVR